MKKAFCLFIFLLILFGFNNANSQNFSVFNCDGSKHPTVKAKFFAFDAEGNQITGLSPADFTVTENGIPRTVTNVSCPEQKPKQPLSLALGIDISGSMTPWNLGKQLGIALSDYLKMPPSEMALQVCDSRVFIVQDFTMDKSEIVTRLYMADDGHNDDKTGQLLNWDAGLLNIVKYRDNKRIAVLFTDAYGAYRRDLDSTWEDRPTMRDSLFQACVDTCAKNNIQFYPVINRNTGPAPEKWAMTFKRLADASGGYFYDNITDSLAVIKLAKTLVLQAQSGDPCEIEWESYPVCESKLVDVQINLKKNNSVANVKYHPAYYRLTRLDFSPITVKFLYAVPGIQRDTTITVTAINADYSVSNITCSNPAFSISPTNFFLKAGESRDLRISFLPIDSCYTYTKFTFANDYCPRDYYASGGFPGIKPKIPTIKLIEPNGGQEFVAGIDTIITWEGVPPDEMVKLEYSTNNGVDWIQISNNAEGLSYRWKVPKTPSKVCLVRVTANGGFPEVNICNQKWMGYNLDINHYRNGDLIPEVKDSTEWANLQTGAWCYFDNDPINGAIYGKLYNQWAVNDSRGLAPIGWQIPTRGSSEDYPGDWYNLVECLGGWNQAGGKLKTTGNTRYGSGLWIYPNAGATNESGFAGLPGGYRDSKGLFTGALGMGGYWWSMNSSFSLHYFSAQSGNLGGSGNSVRCIRDTAEAYYQSDVSNAVFAIVVPEASSKDIDMKKCLVGGVKDSLIADVIRNTGSYKFRVDTVYFSGGDESAFSITSEFEKCELAPGETKAMKFVFLPNRVGIHNSTVNIVTQCDTLKQSIQGEGVEQQIEIVSQILNFGIVQLGKDRTFQDTTLIKNISNSPLDITNVVQLGPDKTQFEILGGGGAFTLQPNETRKLTVRFKPIYDGRTSGQIGFEYAGIGSPAIVQLFGNGIGGLKITIKNDSAYAGQVRRLKLMMSNVKPEDISATAPNFSAKIRFQKTILTPVKKADRNIVNDSIYMNIKGIIGTNIELAQIPVMAGLGIVSETSIDIVDFTLTNSAGEKVDYDIETTSGKFKLLGVCEEGGTRLFNSAGKVEIMEIIPNPASDNVEINVNLIEDGATTLSVYNYNGTKLQEITLQGETGLRTINLDTRNFDNGLYFIKLQTPTVITNQKLMIIR